MKTVYLHIGFHKTGTSSIQEILTNSRNLLNRENYDYPVSLSPFPSHQELSWCLFDEQPSWADKKYDREEVYRTYVERIGNSKYENIILSSEEFSSLGYNREAIVYIREKFKDYHVKVVAYVRNPIDFILSLYHHALRAGKTSLSFKEFLVSNIDLSSADFSSRLRLWKDIFGKENILVGKYVPYTPKGIRLIDDFLNKIGLEKTLDFKDKQSNVGFHCWLYEPLNYIEKSELGEEEKARLKNKLFKLGLLFPKDIDAVSHYLPDDDVKLIRKFYQRKLNAFSKEYDIVI